MELRHLRAFLAVADTASFSEAARRMYVSQQALSRSIQALERELGVTLFERRPVKLTAAGDAMIGAARRSVAAADEVAGAARGDTERPLRVDISSGSIQTGAAIVRRMRRTHPDIAIEQVELGVRRGLQRLRSHALDAVLGIITEPPADLRVELVRREPVLMAMASDHPLAANERVAVAALAGVELLLPSDEAAGEWVAFVYDFCRRAGVDPIRRAGATHSSGSAADVLRDGTCVTPTAAWTDELDGLAFRPLVDPTPLIPWSLAWRRDDRQATRFAECAREVARAGSWATA
jgi:DNA-binding transcriptional LysR family regulator